MRRPTKAVLVLTVVALTAGCGLARGDGGSTAGGEPASQISSPPPPQTFPASGEFWHAGFHVTLTGATIAARPLAFGDGWQRSLTIDAMITNLGPQQQRFGSDVAVEANGTSYPSGAGTDLSPVPSGLTSEGHFSFDIDDSFDYDVASLVVGGGQVTQARLPLGTQGGEPVTREPQELAITGIASLELVDIHVTSAELRSDVPESYTAIPAGQLALTLHLNATSRRRGNWILFPEFFALVTPNGTAVGVAGGDLGSIQGADGGIDNEGLSIRFLIPDPAAGQYTLRFNPSGALRHDDDDPDGATLTFTI